MRILKYAILGLVNHAPSTGYDITKHFNDSLSKFWDAKHSQIYPELKRLLDDGLVEYQLTIQGEKMEKKLYSITDAGRKELLDWLRMEEPLAALPKDSFRLRMYFVDSLSPKERSALLNSQYGRICERLDSLEAKMRSFTGTGRIEPAEIGDFLLINGAVQRDMASLRWLEDCAGYLGVSIAPELLRQPGVQD